MVETQWRYKWQALYDTCSVIRRAGHDATSATSRFAKEATVALVEGRHLGGHRSADEDRDIAMQACCESEWLKQGRPYYKITSSCYQALLRTSLDHCRLNDIRLPFHVIELRFPNGSWNKCPVGLLALACFDSKRAFGHGVLQCLCQESRKLDDAADGMTVPVSLICSWSFEADPLSQTIGEAKKNRGQCLPGTEALSEELDNHLHVAICTALLATHSHDEMFSPILLRRDEPRWEKATDEVRKRMVDRARRLHRSKGWIAGRDLRCPTIRKEDSCGDNPPTGQHLTYQHWRAGHFHRVHYGEGRVRAKLRWFRPTLVRPDLPIAPKRERRYRVALPSDRNDMVMPEVLV